LLLRTYLLRPHVHARELAFSRKALFPSQPPGNPRAAFTFPVNDAAKISPIRFWFTRSQVASVLLLIPPVSPILT